MGVVCGDLDASGQLAGAGAPWGGDPGPTHPLRSLEVAPPSSTPVGLGSCSYPSICVPTRDAGSI